MPSGKIGKTVKSYSGSGFPEIYEFEFKEFTGHVSTYIKGERNYITLVLMLNINKNNIIKFSSKIIEVITDGEVLKYNFNKIVGFNYGEAGINYDGSDFGLHNVLEQNSFSGSDYEAYGFTIDIDVSPEEFTVKFPFITINSKIVDIGKITFKKKYGTSVVPIN